MKEIIYTSLGIIGFVQILVIIFTFFFALGYVLSEKKRTLDLFWIEKLMKFWQKILRRVIK